MNNDTIYSFLSIVESTHEPAASLLLHNWWDLSFVGALSWSPTSVSGVDTELAQTGRPTAQGAFPARPRLNVALVSPTPRRDGKRPEALRLRFGEIVLTGLHVGDSAAKPFRRMEHTSNNPHGRDPSTRSSGTSL
jgi:hypothetical protein